MLAVALLDGVPSGYGYPTTAIKKLLKTIPVLEPMAADVTDYLLSRGTDAAVRDDEVKRTS